MKNTMTYKGYAARVEYSEEDGCFGASGRHCRCGWFSWGSVSELRAAFEEAVEDYLEACAKIGRPPQKPHSGKMMLRVPPEIHAKASIAAKLAGKSLNQWALDELKRAVE